MLVKLILLFFIILICYQLYLSQTIIESLTSGESLKDHDAIIEIQAELNTKYRPLIENSMGKPVNILSRLVDLESNVEVLTNEIMKTSKEQVEAVPAPPKVEPLPAGN
jgi:hypothetical protein